MIGDIVYFDLGFFYNSFAGELLEIRHNPKNVKEFHAKVKVVKEYYKSWDIYRPCTSFEVYLPINEIWCVQDCAKVELLPVIDAPPLHMESGECTIIYTIPNTDKVVARVDTQQNTGSRMVQGMYLPFILTKNNELKWIKGTKIPDKRYKY